MRTQFKFVHIYIVSSISNSKKKRNWKIVDFVVPADHRIKLKESEKKDKYLGELINICGKFVND